MEAYISDFKKKEFMNEETDSSSEAKAAYKWLRSQVIDTCDDLQREGYVLPKGVLDGDLQLTRDAVEMGIDNPVEVAESLLQYLKDQIRYCSFAQMDWLKEHYEDLRLTLKQYFSACDRDPLINYLDKNFPKMEAVNKERSYEKIDEAKMEDKWDRTSLGYYEGTKYVAYESKDGQTIQISSLHPYDDAEYYWACTYNGGKTYRIIRNGKTESVFKGNPDAEYNDILSVLVKMNKDIEPKMMHEEVRENMTESENKITFWQSDDYSSHDFDPYEEEMLQNGLVICGNRDKVDMGDPDLIDLIKQYHDVDLVLAGLKKATGKNYKKRTIRGYTQGDWNTLFYPEGTSDKTLDTIEDMYMGNYNVFFTEEKDVEPNYVYVLDSQLRGQDDVEDIIARETGLSPDGIEVKQISGYSSDPIYESVDDAEEEARWSEVKELIGGRGEFLGQIDEYRDFPIYKYRTEGGEEIVYFLTGPDVLNDRFEFDAKDEEVVTNCIDAYKENGVEAADKVWQEAYTDKMNENYKTDIEYNVYVGDELFDVVDNPEEAESLIEQCPEITRIEKVSCGEQTGDCVVEIIYKKPDKKNNKKMSARERFELIDDEIDEEVEDIQTVYSVSYVVGDGPYQAIMVRADSEEEAIKKFQKQNPDADVIAAGIEYDVDEMRRRGKPLMEEIEDDISMREWYVKTFPNDSVGQEINPEATFNDLQAVLDDGVDIYKLIGVGDSIVRERLFDKLADLTGVAYDDIYEKWINSEEINDQFLTSIRDRLERGEG